MKNTLSLILSLVMLLTLLAGCSNDEGDSSSESEQEVEQSENLLETEIYYDTIELSKSDFLEIPPTNILLYGYVDFESYLTEDALEKVDES